MAAGSAPWMPTIVSLNNEASSGFLPSQSKIGIPNNFSKPLLPAFLRQVTIRDLRVGEARVDLLLTRHEEGDVGVNVLRRDGALDVVVLK